MTHARFDLLHQDNDLSLIHVCVNLSLVRFSFILSTSELDRLWQLQTGNICCNDAVMCQECQGISLLIRIENQTDPLQRRLRATKEGLVFVN